MAKKWLLLPLTGAAGLLLYRGLRTGDLGLIVQRWERIGMPSVAAYDGLVGTLLQGLYLKVAREVAAACQTGRVLDVGAGPGRLDVRLAQVAPSLSITGVDVDPDMVERATGRAVKVGVVGRVHFEVGDAAALPFKDGEFDLVVSTVSLHHWEAPFRGLTEIHRVLKPGGEALIYDVPHLALRLFRHGTATGTSMLEMAEASPFRGGEFEAFQWPGSFPLLRRLRLRRSTALASDSGGDMQSSRQTPTSGSPSPDT